VWSYHDTMKLPFRRHEKVSRGQAMVEFAIILPLLALLLVMAIDFGRVFFGAVALQNAARIGADFAASHADAWDSETGGEDENDRDRYRASILSDLQALNCTLEDPVPPDPVFDTDVDGDGDFYTDGDIARVELACDFGLLTPLAEAALGGPVSLRTRADFAITRTINANLPEVVNPPPPLCDPPVASFTTVPAPASGGRVQVASGGTVAFTDTSTTAPSCAIEEWLWEFGDGAESNQPNVDHVFVYGGSGGNTNYLVRLTVTSDGGSDTETIIVRVPRP
jgi:hypothetical protein